MINPYFHNSELGKTLRCAWACTDAIPVIMIIADQMMDKWYWKTAWVVLMAVSVGLSVSLLVILLCRNPTSDERVLAWFHIVGSFLNILAVVLTSVFILECTTNKTFVLVSQICFAAGQVITLLIPRYLLKPHSELSKERKQQIEQSKNFWKAIWHKIRSKCQKSGQSTAAKAYNPMP